MIVADGRPRREPARRRDRGASPTRDSELAAEVVADDARVDELEREIDNLALRLLALRQPMARDLREIVVGAQDLAAISSASATTPPTSPSASIALDPGRRRVQPGQRDAAHGAGSRRQMIKDVLDAYVERDADKALAGLARATRSSTRCTPACSASC